MEGKIVEGPIGQVGKFSVRFEGGVMVFEANESDKYGETSFRRTVPAKVVLDAIKDAIPGKVDDAVIGVLEAALIGA